MYATIQCIYVYIVIYTYIYTHTQHACTHTHTHEHGNIDRLIPTRVDPRHFDGAKNFYKKGRGRRKRKERREEKRDMSQWRCWCYSLPGTQ